MLDPAANASETLRRRIHPERTLMDKVMVLCFPTANRFF